MVASLFVSIYGSDPIEKLDTKQPEPPPADPRKVAETFPDVNFSSVPSIYAAYLVFFTWFSAFINYNSAFSFPCQLYYTSLNRRSHVFL